MPPDGNIKTIVRLSSLALTLFAWIIPYDISALESITSSTPPDRCAGYGDLQSVSLTDWEAGLGVWSVGRRSVSNPATFDTPDWAVVGSLPDARSGQAVFVPNLDIGNCGDDDETGVLFLESPPIVIPGNTAVPRISIDHWFDIEPRWDGGNFRISVNGGAFNPVPASAIELAPYNDTLFPALDEFGFVNNSNPLAEQEAFTGRFDGQPTGSWIQTRINLLGIADAGDTVELRFDFGIDGCGGEIGWYVDDVDFYSCAAELPPSDCGNGVIDPPGEIDPPEQCDDGNDFIGDGCSNTCQIEEGWLCTDPTPAGTIADPSFEAGRPNPSWTEVSNNFLGSPICDVATCNTGGGSGPSDGTYWVWLGGTRSYQEGSVSQSIVIPSTVRQLAFDLEIPVCDSASDYFEVLIDGNQELFVDGSDSRCGTNGYTSQAVDISAYADGAAHDLEIHSETFSNNGGVSSFFIDVVSLPGSPSSCRRENTSLTLANSVINDDGGSALASAWTLTATGPSTFSGPGPVVSSAPGFLPGSYALSESGGQAGYSTSAWACDGGNLVGNTVTLALDETATCYISNDDIAPTLKVINTIVNNNGGLISDPNVFGLKIDGIPVLHNAANIVDFGDHTVSENGLSGYAPGTWGGNCNTDGTITLALGQNATCTIINDDIPPRLTVVNTIVNNDGGGVTDPDAFGLRIDGLLVFDSTPAPVNAGTRTVSEDGLPGYQAGAWGGDCAANGSVTLALDQDATCNITNDDVAPTLTLVKHLPNDNGGTATQDQFQAYIDGNPVDWNTPIPLVAGVHSVSEDSLPGYQASPWFNACSADGTVTLDIGEQLTCEITNDDVAPTLTLVKHLPNDNGGTATQDQFQAYIDGNPVDWNTPIPLVAGVHSASEDNLPGYQASTWFNACAANGVVTLNPGDQLTCEITNDDVAPTLRLVKHLPNDDGGTATQNQFQAYIDGNPVPWNTPILLDAGLHTATEDNLPGYQASSWFNACAADGTVTLDPGDQLTCEITNDDQGGDLVLFNEVTNDNGGTSLPPAWTLAATGPVTFSGPGPSVASGPEFVAGTYTLTQSGGPSGYTASAWVCDGGTLNGNSVTLTPGQSVNCTITNDDRTATLKVVKSIINDNGGLVTDPNAFGLRIDGVLVSDNVRIDVDAGNHTVSEDGLPGYIPEVWEGSCNADGTITLALAQSGTCFITNNDTNTTSLTLVKKVVNDNGGSAKGSDWILSASGLTPFSGPGPNVANEPDFAAGTYDLSASGGLPGYTTSAWICVGGSLIGNSVTLALGESATCTITSDDISPTLTLVKNIENNNGGTVTDPDAFGLRIDGLLVFDSVANPVNAGTRTASEDGLPGYQGGSWAGNCDVNGNINLVLGQSATCTITNDDIEPGLTLTKEVINDNGGEAVPSDWTLSAAGPTPLSGPGPSVSSPANFKAGSYVLSESTGPDGYTAGNWLCDGGSLVGDTLTLVLGESANCTITSDDQMPSLVLDKIVVNNHGGTAAESDWTLFANGGPTPISGPGAAGSTDVQSSTNFKAGTYNLSESTGPAGYTAFSWNCVGGSLNGSAITLALGESATCSITNDDQAPSLVLDKIVVNNNGGTAAESDWTLFANGGPTPISGPGAAGSTDVQSGIDFEAGTYNLSESTGPDGYTASSWSCVGGSLNGSTITIALGESANCTITNDDDAVSLTLNKVVTNDNGGVAVPSDWTLSATGPTPLSGPGPSVSSPANFKAGSYVLSESTGPDGYTAGDWLCDGGSLVGNTLTLAQGESATCTITNDDQAPNLILDKIVVNNNGGTAAESDWTLFANDGPTPISGPGAAGSTDVQSGIDFEAGTYNLSESTGPDGYTASSWSCVGGSLDGAAISIALGEAVICTITNDDDGLGLTMNKLVTNDNGGEAVAADWTLSATGPTPFSGPGPSVSSPENFEAGSYVLSESTGPDGYTASDWLCDGGSLDGNTLTMALGESVTCTITNDDDTVALTLNKVVINNNGGEAVPSDWTLSAVGPTPLSGPGPSVSSPGDFEAGSYVLSESTGPDGYTASNWLCDGGSLVGDTLTLALGESAVCTITNDDNGAGLILIKEVINDNEGEAVPADWTLSAAGPTPFSGPGPTVSSGEDFEPGGYKLSESTGPDGYIASDWVCNGGSLDGDTITLALGESATCTITNDDDGIGEVIFTDGFE